MDDPLLTFPREARRRRPARNRCLAPLALILGLTALGLALGLTGVQVPL